MDRLKNKTAIITGAAGGIGAAQALLFAGEGAHVTATDIAAPKNDWLQKATAEGLSIQFIQHDVTNENDWKNVIEKTIQQFGKLDILVNNAGIFPGFEDCEHTSAELWNRVIAINLTGAFTGCRLCIPLLKKNGGGSIVNIASIAGLAGGNGPAYSASKGGLRLLSKDLAAAYAKDNIRVNTVCPGAVLTPMTETMLDTDAMSERIKNMSPQGRVAAPVEIAYAALYLASDEASFTTGTDLVADGGALAV